VRFFHKDDKNRVLALTPAGQKNSRFPKMPQSQLLRVFAIGKVLDLRYNSGCLLALKKNKKLSESMPVRRH